MNAISLAWRNIAWTVRVWSILQAEKKKEKLRWPDKSGAVGVGLGNWNKTIISAVTPPALLAIILFSVMFLKQYETSASGPRRFMIFRR